MSNDTLTSLEVSTACCLLIGEQLPEAKVGIMPDGNATKAVYIGTDGAMLVLILPYEWPFADEDDPDTPVDMVAIVTAGSLREAIVSTGTDRIMHGGKLTEIDEDLPDEAIEWFDRRSFRGRQIGEIKPKRLAKILDRVRSADLDGRVHIEGSISLAGDALEFVRLGVFTGDEDLAIASYEQTWVALTGTHAIVAWTSP